MSKSRLVEEQITSAVRAYATPLEVEIHEWQIMLVDGDRARLATHHGGR